MDNKDKARLLQERLVQCCIDFINEVGDSEIYSVDFTADDLQTSSKECKWTPATDSWITLNGISDDGIVEIANYG